MKSKKRSVANSKSRLPERPTLFIDRSLGHRVVADALRHEGARIELHDDHFVATTSDETWLKAIGAKGWIILTKDHKIRYNPRAVHAIKESKVIIVSLARGNYTGSQMAEMFVKALRGIENLPKRVKPPAFFTFGKRGRLRRVEI